MNENIPTPVESQNGAVTPYGGPAPGLDHWADEHDEEGSISPRRIWAALVRHKWILVAAAVLGAGAAALAYRSVEPEYRAQGSLWINVDNDRSTMGEPIAQGGLLVSTAWMDLLRSFQVLDPVVTQERLYLQTDPADSAIFSDFTLADRFQAGRYELQVSEDGRTWTLSNREGQVHETGRPGDSIGAELGFLWRPPASALPPGHEAEFRVVAPRDASVELFNQLQTNLDRAGNFITLSLMGPEPEKVTQVLRAVMDRHVALAANLKSRVLDEKTKILREQLDRVQGQLQTAEGELQNFQIQTVTLPSEQSGPVAPGLQQTQDPVFADFFARRVELDNLRLDRQRIQRALDDLPAEGGLAIEAFELIPSVGQSTELQAALSNLVDARAELRALLQDYTEEHQLVREAQDRVRTLERQTIPSLARSLLARLGDRVAELEETLEDRGRDLEEIPVRSIQESQLQRERQIANNLYVELQNRHETARLAAASSIPDVEILDQPAVPQVPYEDERVRWALLAFFGLLGAGVAAVVMLDRFDPRIRYPLQVQDDLGVEILGAIPRIRVRGRVNTGEVTEAFREIRMRLEFAYGSAKPLIVAVTSPDTGEGKTLVSANLAIAFSQLGKRTLLIDADTRRGDMHELLEMDRKPGLTDALRGNVDGSVVRATGHDHLHFVGSGTRISSSPELLSGSRMQDLMALAKQRFDAVIVDCPPMAAGGDAFVLGAHAGAVMLVMRSGSTHKELAKAKVEAFYRLPVRILGAVLNDVEENGSHGMYRYYSYYLPGYRAGSEEDEQQRQEQRRRDAEQPSSEPVTL